MAPKPTASANTGEAQQTGTECFVPAAELRPVLGRGIQFRKMDQPPTQADAITIAQANSCTNAPSSSIRWWSLILELPLAMAALQQSVALADGGVLDHDLGIGIAPSRYTWPNSWISLLG